MYGAASPWTPLITLAGSRLFRNSPSLATLPYRGVGVLSRPLTRACAAAALTRNPETDDGRASSRLARSLLTMTDDFTTPPKSRARPRKSSTASRLPAARSATRPRRAGGPACRSISWQRRCARRHWLRSGLHLCSALYSRGLVEGSMGQRGHKGADGACCLFGQLRSL
jgi:hypothetical protein